MSTPRACIREVRTSTGDNGKNSRSAEAIRRRLQDSMPHGGWCRIAERLGWRDRRVNDQAEGADPLHVTVLLEALGEISAAVLPKAQAVAEEMLAPCGLAVIRRPGEGPTSDVLSAHAEVLGALSRLEASFATAIEDGDLDDVERATLISALRDMTERCRTLETRLGARGR